MSDRRLEKIEKALDVLESDGQDQERRYNADNYARATLDDVIREYQELGHELSDEAKALVNRAGAYYGIDTDEIMGADTQTTSNTNASSSDYETEGFEKDLETIERESRGDIRLKFKWIAEYTLNNATLFATRKKCFNRLKKESKKLLKEMKKAKIPLPNNYEELFYFFKHRSVSQTRLRPQPQEPQPQEPQPQEPQEPHLNDLLPSSAKKIPILGNNQRQQLQRMKQPQQMGIVFKKLKRALSLGQKAKKQTDFDDIQQQLIETLKSIDFNSLTPAELSRLVDFEKPIYDMFGISISDYKKFNTISSNTDYQKSQNNIQQNLSNIRPPDVLEQISGAKMGEPEYVEAEKNAGLLKEIHSQEKINKHLMILKRLGYIGIALSLIVGLIGVHFDIQYHFPDMEKVISSPFIWIFAGFLAILIMVAIHIPLEGMVNDRYLPKTKKVLMWLLLIAIPLKLYVDYKAIKNYSKTIAEEKRKESLGDSTKSAGASITTVNLVKENGQKNLNRINAQLDTYNEQLKSILADRKPQQAIIDKWSSKKGTDWRREQIKNAKIALEKIDMRQSSIQNHINQLQKQQNLYMDSITKNANAVVNILKQSEVLAGEEATSRFWMMVALLSLVELSSLLHVLSDYLRVKNTPITARELASIQGYIDASKSIEVIANKTKATINQANIVAGEQAINSINNQVWLGVQLENRMLESAYKMAEMGNENTVKGLELVSEMMLSHQNGMGSHKLKRQVELLANIKKGGN